MKIEDLKCGTYICLKNGDRVIFRRFVARKEGFIEDFDFYEWNFDEIDLDKTEFYKGVSVLDYIFCEYYKLYENYKGFTPKEFISAKKDEYKLFSAGWNAHADY